MKSVTKNAYAKLNLTLDILGRRDDGYHELSMVMQSITLHDTVVVSEREGREVKLSCDAKYIPNNGDNIAVKAANAFFAAIGTECNGLDIKIDKRIPVCAGMAGGSSDGAAVLLALREMYAPDMDIGKLCRIGEAVGSDVPYCVFGGTALAEGRGEVLTRLAPMPDCFAVICKPDFPISTPELFHWVDDKKLSCRPDTKKMIESLNSGDVCNIAHYAYNVFEDVLPPKYAEVKSIKGKLLDLGALNACMTGSGPTVFGLFDDEKKAAAAYEALSALYEQTYLEKTISNSNV